MRHCITVQKGHTNTYIDLGVLPSLLQVFVDGFVCNLGKQCHIRDTHLLLFDAFFPVCPHGTICFNSLLFTLLAQQFLVFATWARRLVYCFVYYLGHADEWCLYYIKKTRRKGKEEGRNWKLDFPSSKKLVAVVRKWNHFVHFHHLYDPQSARLSGTAIGQLRKVLLPPLALLAFVALMIETHSLPNQRNKRRVYQFFHFFPLFFSSSHYIREYHSYIKYINTWPFWYIIYTHNQHGMHCLANKKKNIRCSVNMW